MKFLKKILKEPQYYSSKDPEKILLEDYNWHPLMINTLEGRLACLGIAFGRLKWCIWKELTK